MTWLLGLFANPLVRKIALYAAIIAGILLLLRWYSNRAYYQGVQEGRDKATVEVQKAKEKEWKIQQDNLTQQAEQIAVSRKALNIEQSELSRVRAVIQDTLQRSLNEISTVRRINDAKVDAIPGDQLDDALRAQSAKLAASK